MYNSTPTYFYLLTKATTAAAVTSDSDITLPVPGLLYL